VAPATIVVEVVVDEADRDTEGDVIAVDVLLMNEREREVVPGAREVVAKLGAAAAARGGSNCPAIARISHLSS
jgi:hypothetical protein